MQSLYSVSKDVVPFPAEKETHWAQASEGCVMSKPALHIRQLLVSLRPPGTENGIAPVSQVPSLRPLLLELGVIPELVFIRWSFDLALTFLDITLLQNAVIILGSASGITKACFVLINVVPVENGRQLPKSGATLGNLPHFATSASMSKLVKDWGGGLTNSSNYLILFLFFKSGRAWTLPRGTAYMIQELTEYLC